MAIQDLTPQLRTRLSRLERVVALFVVLALVLMLAGLYFYVRRTAERRGWFLVKLPYFTFVDSAAGLKVGDPVKMMGFDVGEITYITAQPATDPEYNVFVAFTITENPKARYNGYMWDDSRAKVVSSLLGARYLEVTKGTNGVPAYYFHEVQTNDLASLRGETTGRFVLAEEIWDSTKKKLLERANQPVNDALISRLEFTGVSSVTVLDTSTQLEWPTHIWHDQSGRYVSFDHKKDKGYFLPPDEDPAVTELASQMLAQVKEALPNVLGLTNRLQRLLDESANAAAQADALLTAARPVLTNLAFISANLTNPTGSLGEWLLPPDVNTNLSRTLSNANTVIVSANLVLTNADAHVAELAGGLAKAVEELAGITANLRRQVDANTNILSHVSQLIVDTDTFVQGLKRHWLLRSAFKEKKTNAPPARPSRTFVPPKLKP